MEISIIRIIIFLKTLPKVNVLVLLPLTWKEKELFGISISGDTLLLLYEPKKVTTFLSHRKIPSLFFSHNYYYSCVLNFLGEKKFSPLFSFALFSLFCISEWEGKKENLVGGIVRKKRKALLFSIFWSQKFVWHLLMQIQFLNFWILFT